MEKTWFNNLSIIISLVLVVPQICLYIVGVLARVDEWVETIGWYSYSTKFLGFDVDYYMGLNGVYINSPSLGIDGFTTYSEAADDDGDGSDVCSNTAFRSLLLTGIAAVMSMVLLVVVVMRKIYFEDSYRMRGISMITAFITFGLGVPAYVIFYNDCVLEFFDNLDEEGFTDIKGINDPGGACVIAAIICGVMIAFINVIEILGTYCGCCAAKPATASFYNAAAANEVVASKSDVGGL